MSILLKCRNNRPAEVVGQDSFPFPRRLSTRFAIWSSPQPWYVCTMYRLQNRRGRLWHSLGISRKLCKSIIWPPLPIIIRNIYHFRYDHSRESDYKFNSVLLHRDRICQIHLRYSRRSQFERLVSAMQGQFPALTHLALDYFSIRKPTAPALPDWFLGGHAPRLQTHRDGAYVP